MTKAASTKTNGKTPAGRATASNPGPRRVTTTPSPSTPQKGVLVDPVLVMMREAGLLSTNGLNQIQRTLAEKDLHEFVQQAWPIVDPDTFVDNWHIQAICRHLEAVSRGQIRNLIINVPPRHTKSLLVSVLWPAWEWAAVHQSTRWLFTSYAASLSIRDSVKCRRLIQSPWYQKFWADRYQLTSDQNAKERYDNNRGGYRLATSVDGLGTGEGGDKIVCDDIHNAKEALVSKASLETVQNWWKWAMSTRGNDPQASARVVIMQRVHEDDLVGYILANSGNEWEKLILPAEYEPTSHTTNIGFKDPRKRSGELLWPHRYGTLEIDKLKRELGAYAASAQLQQRPSPATGGIFQRQHWKFYPEVPREMARECAYLCQSWDLSFKSNSDSSRVAGQVWGAKNANRFLIDSVCAHMTFTETLDAMRNMTAKWPKAEAKFVEGKANGPAVMDVLRHELGGLIEVNPTDSKEARAFAVTPLIEAGNVYLPDPAAYPWVDEFIEELTQFNRGKYNDQVDTCTQALLEMKRRMRGIDDIAPLISMNQRSVWAGASMIR